MGRHSNNDTAMTDTIQFCDTEVGYDSLATPFVSQRLLKKRCIGFAHAASQSALSSVMLSQARRCSMLLHSHKKSKYSVSIPRPCLPDGTTARSGLMVDALACCMEFRCPFIMHVYVAYVATVLRLSVSLCFWALLHAVQERLHPLWLQSADSNR